MFSFFDRMAYDTPVVSLIDGFNVEDPMVQQKREEAMRKMKEINRPSLLKGGHFSLHNTVLQGATR